MGYCVINIHDIEPRVHFRGCFIFYTVSLSGQWQGKEFEILVTKSDKGRGGSIIADFLVTPFLIAPKTFRGRLARLLNVLCTFDFCRVSRVNDYKLRSVSKFYQ